MCCGYCLLTSLSTIFQLNLTLCTFFFEINESSLSGTRCLMQLEISPNLIKIRSTHLFPIFYRFCFDCRELTRRPKKKKPIENREQVRRSTRRPNKKQQKRQKIGSKCADLILIRLVYHHHTGDKRMARRCTRSSLSNDFVMTSCHWKAEYRMECRGKHIDDFVMASCYWKAKYRMQCRGKRIDDFVMMSCDLKAKYRMCKRTFIPPCVYSDQALFSPGFYGTAVLNV